MSGLRSHVLPATRFIKMNAKPSRIAFTTQRLDTPVHTV